MRPDLPSAPTSVQVLIVEDSRTQAQRLRALLERHGYVVTHCANGQLALDAARKTMPTLIISDVIMPEMDGYELCRQVKSDPRLAAIPLILVTALSDAQDVIRGLECLADSFILKPYEEKHLLSRVEYVLSNRRQQARNVPADSVDVFFNGSTHTITADRRQILDLLLSTYEAAIQRNKQLTQSQQELHRINSKLESVISDLEAFSYSVSHDLRAPLRHVSGYIEFLRKKAMPKLGEEEVRLIEKISKSAHKMGQLIEDLLEFSRMGQTDLRYADVDLNRVMQETIQRLEPETRGRTIRWTLGVLPTVRGDRAMLEQVFFNLLGNAVKYTGKRAVAEITIGCSADKHATVVYVRDNGAGFDMACAERLFGVFQRLHSEHEFEGTGIGLANVRRIITRHGGRTWAESKVDEGATFYVLIPNAVGNAVVAGSGPDSSSAQPPPAANPVN